MGYQGPDGHTYADRFNSIQRFGFFPSGLKPSRELHYKWEDGPSARSAGFVVNGEKLQRIPVLISFISQRLTDRSGKVSYESWIEDAFGLWNQAHNVRELPDITQPDPFTSYIETLFQQNEWFLKSPRNTSGQVVNTKDGEGLKQEKRVVAVWLLTPEQYFDFALLWKEKQQIRPSGKTNPKFNCDLWSWIKTNLLTRYTGGYDYLFYCYPDTAKRSSAAFEKRKPWEPRNMKPHHSGEITHYDDCWFPESLLTKDWRTLRVWFDKSCEIEEVKLGIFNWEILT